MDRFQKAYHNAILAFIENYKSLDFARISKQINQDLIIPQVGEIEKKYKRITSLHKSLALTGAAVSLIPIGGVILSDMLLNQILVSDLVKAIPPTLASLITTIATNKIYQDNAIQAFEDNAFYILWKLKNTR